MSNTTNIKVTGHNNETVTKTVKVLFNWEAIRDFCGGFYSQATFERGDAASFLCMLPEVPRVLYSYYNYSHPDFIKSKIMIAMYNSVSVDSYDWRKYNAQEIVEKLKASEWIRKEDKDAIDICINSILDSDYWRAMSYIKNNLSSDDDNELARIFMKALDKSKTDKVKVNSEYFSKISELKEGMYYDR